MITKKLFTKKQIRENPMLKKAIEDCNKKGYNVNEYFVLEVKDLDVLLNLKEVKK